MIHWGVCSDCSKTFEWVVECIFLCARSFYRVVVLIIFIMRLTPYDEMKIHFEQALPEALHQFFPRKWEKLGDVVVVRFSDELSEFESIVGSIIAGVLKCRSVVREQSAISGNLRLPDARVIFGDENTQTVHKENGICFALDPCKVMFSSGNMDERIRMAHISSGQEFVVDMFAGIGYFSIPLAVYCRPKKVVCCELNPVAADFLKKNCVLNGVQDDVEVRVGDCRDVCPKGVADRVLMGFFDGTRQFLPAAFSALKKEGGLIHFHEVFFEEQVPKGVEQMLKENAKRNGRKLVVNSFRVVKSTAPRMVHVVFDCEVSSVV